MPLTLGLTALVVLFTLAVTASSPAAAIVHTVAMGVVFAVGLSTHGKGGQW